jgi:hypothetical protein
MSDTLIPPKRVSLERVTRLTLTEAQQQQAIWELADELLGPVPPEELDRAPYEAAQQIDRYLYGWVALQEGFLVLLT